MLQDKTEADACSIHSHMQEGNDTHVSKGSRAFFFMYRFTPLLSAARAATGRWAISPINANCTACRLFALLLLVWKEWWPAAAMTTCTGIWKSA